MNCSFCGNSEEEAEVIVTASEQNVSICSDCVDICNNIIAEERAK